MLPCVAGPGMQTLGARAPRNQRQEGSPAMKAQRKAAEGPRGSRANSRLPQILDAAAMQFAAKGYQAASIRDIVQDVGMQAGSLYCHFANKDELLAAVYAEGVRRITRAVRAAVARHDEPWARLEAGCIAHLEALLDQGAYAQVVVKVSPDHIPAIRAELVALRDGYEALFGGLVADLPLPPDTPREMLRLMLLGALNWTPTWRRADGAASPKAIARHYLHLLRTGLERAPSSAV